MHKVTKILVIIFGIYNAGCNSMGMNLEDILKIGDLLNSYDSTELDKLNKFRDQMIAGTISDEDSMRLQCINKMLEDEKKLSPMIKAKLEIERNKITASAIANDGEDGKEFHDNYFKHVIAGSNQFLLKIAEEETAELQKAQEVQKAKDKKIQKAKDKKRKKNLDKKLLRALNLQLHEAVKKGNTAEIMELVGKGANKDAQDQTGRTPLHSATYASDVETVAWLVSVRANANLKTNNGLMPLHIALSSAHSESAAKQRAQIAEILLAHTDPRLLEERTPHGLTFLHVATVHGNLQMVEMLIKAGADFRAVVQRLEYQDKSEDDHVNDLPRFERTRYESNHYTGMNSLNLSEFYGHKALVEYFERLYKSNPE